MLQSDRGTLDCCNNKLPCSLCLTATRFPSPLLRNHHPPSLPKVPTDPDLYWSKTLNPPHTYDSLPDKETDDSRLIRTRTGSLNEKIFRIPHVEITTADYTSCDRIFVNDIDNTLLSVRRCIDPYTPESIDSHSPNVDSTSGFDLTVPIDIVNGDVDKSVKLNRDRSVSPTLLRNRLDKLLIDKERPATELRRFDSRESFKSDSSKIRGLCCLMLKCYGFCRYRVRKVKCDCTGLTKCCS